MSKCLKQRWWDFHKANPKVNELFEAYSFEVIRAGHNKCSHWLIINRIRWQHMIDTSRPNNEQFKISNDYIAFYARLFMANHPEHNGFFNLKEMKRK